MENGSFGGKVGVETGDGLFASGRGFVKTAGSQWGCLGRRTCRVHTKLPLLGW